MAPVGGQDEPERYNPDDRVIIDLRLDIKGEPDAPGSREDTGKRGRGRRFMADQGNRRARTHRHLRKLLRTLMHSADFAQSSQLIELPKIVSLPAKRFFYRLRASAAATGTFRGYWGIVRSAVVSGQTIWLNTEGPVIPVNVSDQDLLL